MNFVQQCRLNTLLVHKIKKRAESDWFVDDFWASYCSSGALTKLVAQFMQLLMDMTGKEYRLERILECQARTDQIVHENSENKIQIPPKYSSSGFESSYKRKSRRKDQNSSHTKCESLTRLMSVRKRTQIA